MAISGDGSYVVVGMEDGTVALFNKNNAGSDWTAEWSYITGGDVSSVDISAIGNNIIAGSDDNFVYLFTQASETPTTYDIGDDVVSVSISNSGGYMVAGSGDEDVYFFINDIISPLRLFSTTGAANHTIISGNGKYITAGAEGGTYWFQQDPNKRIGSNSSLDTYDLASSDDGLYTVVGTETGELLLFYANSAPEIELDSPENNKQTSQTFLVWNCTDEDGDDLTYDIYLGTSKSQVFLIDHVEQSPYVLHDRIAHGTTYYWKVVASDGVHETQSIIRNFTFEDIPPTVTFTSAEIKSGSILVTGTAADEIAIVDVKVKVIPPGVDKESIEWAIAQGTENWTYAWCIKEGATEGDYDIYIKSYDGHSHSDNISANKTLAKPELTIDHHDFDPDDESFYILRGTADSDDGIVSVRVQVGTDGDWYNADGTEDWEFLWYTYTIKPDTYTLTVEAFDGAWYATQSVEVTTTG